MWSGSEVMGVLTDADMEGLDPTAQTTHGTKHGRTPTECFYLKRDQSCAILREPFEKEEQVWWNLMASACRQNGVDFDTFEPRWRSKYEERNSQKEKLTPDSADDYEDKGTDDIGSDNENQGRDFADALESQSKPTTGDEVPAR